MRYRIDCLTSKAQIKDWTNASAADSQEILLSADDHVIQEARNAQEVRQVLIEATYGSSSDRLTTKFLYLLTNLANL